jgi:hypothetical protein
LSHVDCKVGETAILTIIISVVQEKILTGIYEMRNQGWGTAITTDSLLNLKRNLAAPTSLPECDNSESLSPIILKTSNKTDVRLDLLTQIKKKIKSGYYNRDSVIDDIGYGFAQVLDTTL